MKGDRLEPAPACPDVGRVEECDMFPMRLVFWRPSAEGLCKHRSPLMSTRTWISIQSLCVDEMHTMHLGVLGNFVAAALWQMIEADCWNVSAGLPQEAAHERSALAIRQDLFEWYKVEKRARPLVRLYELMDFSLGVLGAAGRQSPHSKAAETGTLLKSALHLCRRFQARLRNGAALLAAGEALGTYLALTRDAGERLTSVERQRLMDATLRFLTLREEAGVLYKPKMHLMVHLIFQTKKFGNPKHVATWFDEGLNRNLAAVASTAHAHVWDRRILATFNHSLGPTARLAKRPRAD